MMKLKKLKSFIEKSKELQTSLSMTENCVQFINCSKIAFSFYAAVSIVL